MAWKYARRQLLPPPTYLKLTVESSRVKRGGCFGCLLLTFIRSIIPRDVQRAGIIKRPMSRAVGKGTSAGQQ